MCVVSMVMDHYWDKWKPHPVIPTASPAQPLAPYVLPQIPVPQISQLEIAEFRRLLERAREYDRKHNQPDCELEEKRAKLKNLAKELGAEINFL